MILLLHPSCLNGCLHCPARSQSTSATPKSCTHLIALVSSHPSHKFPHLPLPNSSKQTITSQHLYQLLSQLIDSIRLLVNMRASTLVLALPALALAQDINSIVNSVGGDINSAVTVAGSAIDAASSVINDGASVASSAVTEGVADATSAFNAATSMFFSARLPLSLHMSDHD